MKRYSEFLNEGMALNPYVGFYKVPNINKVMDDLHDKVEYIYDPGSNVVIIEEDIQTAYKIVMENKGEQSFEWAKNSDYPSNGVLIKAKPFHVPEGAFI